MTKKGKKVNPLWGGRFDSGTNELAQSFSASINIDKRLFEADIKGSIAYAEICLLYTSPSPRDRQKSRMPSSA